MMTNIDETPSGSLPLTLEFQGGAELLVGKQKKHEVQLPDRPTANQNATWTIADLLPWIVANLLTSSSKPDLFVQGDSVRAGILVLVNDTDWELLGTNTYVLRPNDVVTFISTLHGG